MDQPNGLSSKEAAALLASYGPNELPRHERPAWTLLLGHLWGPIAWMIELAALLSALVRDWSDLALILVLLAANAGVGFWEEYKAGNEVAALQAQLALEARVCRDGQWLLLLATMRKIRQNFFWTSTPLWGCHSAQLPVSDQQFLAAAEASRVANKSNNILEHFDRIRASSLRGRKIAIQCAVQGHG